MATEISLNRIVKGAPPPDTKVPPIAPLPPMVHSSADTVASTKSSSMVIDPAVSALPSAPPQIYLNLLILEASLRSQYLQLLTRRRLNTFFLLVLAIWNTTFTYALFLRPREDGTGLGGSPYWVVEAGIRLGFIGGWIAALLVKATGQWERGIRWPRKWVGTTNRGLRGFNLRVAVVKRSLWRESLGHLSSLIPFGLWREAGGSDWHLVEAEGGRIVEEDLSKGGDYVMLLLLPKNFSSEFRENWEAYRTEYWDRENERRGALRQKVKAHRRSKAKEIGGWKWWTGLWQVAPLQRDRRQHDLEKHPQGHHLAHGHSRHGTLSEKEVLAKANRRRSLMRSDSTHSRQSSRSSTPHIEFDGAGEIQRPLTERVRRGSSVSSTGSARKGVRKERRGDGNLLSPLTAADEEGAREKRERSKRSKDKERGSRPSTPTGDAIEPIKREPLAA